MRSSRALIGMVVCLAALSGLLWYLLRTEPTPPGPPAARGPQSEAAPAKPDTGKEAKPIVRASTVMGTVINTLGGDPVTDFEIASLPKPEGDIDLAGLVTSLPWLAVQDEMGRFRLEKVASNVPLLVVARARGHVPGYAEAPPIAEGRAAKGIAISLGPSGTIEGEVTNSKGEAVPGASVVVGDNPELTPCATTDAKGRFFITTVNPEDRVIIVNHPDYISAREPIEVAGGGKIQVRIVLNQGGTVEGAVLRDGEPIPNQQVQIMRYPASNPVRQIMRSGLDTRTGPDGRYRLVNIPAGDITIRVVLEGRYANVSAAATNQDGVVENGKTTVIDFDLPSASSGVEGTVLVNGQPPDEGVASVKFTGNVPEDTASVQVQADGHYRIGNITPGSVTIEASLEGRDGPTRKKTAAVEAGENETVHQDFEFTTPSVVSGAVTGVLDNEKCVVMALAGNVGPVMITSMDDYSRIQPSIKWVIELPEDGAFRVEGLEAGVYTMAALSTRVNDKGVPEPGAPIRAASQAINVRDGTEIVLNLAVR